MKRTITALTAALLYGAAFWALRDLAHLDAGQAFGLIAIFHVVLIPGFLLAYFACALLGKRLQLLSTFPVALAFSAWMAWGLVMSPGTSHDLTDPATHCYDRQGSYTC